MKKITLLIITVLGITTIYGQGLVGHYPFDSNGNDISGSNNHFTITNGVYATDVNSNPSSSLYLDSLSGSYGLASNFTGFSDTAFTISLWYKGNYFDTHANTAINGKNNGSGLFSFSLEQFTTTGFWPNADSVGIQFYVYKTNFGIYTQTVTTIDTNWNYVTCTFQQNDSVKIYINGVYITGDTLNFTGGLASVADEIMISNTNNNFRNALSRYDELRIYNRALSSTEIMNLYNGTTNINELNNEKTFSVYPNPVSNTLNIASQSAFSKINILDVNGKLIKSKNSKVTTINVADLISGFYIMVLLDENNQPFARQKFIKQ